MVAEAEGDLMALRIGPAPTLGAVFQAVQCMTRNGPSQAKTTTSGGTFDSLTTRCCGPMVANV
jgi:hypothetical protein